MNFEHALGLFKSVLDIMTSATGLLAASAGSGASILGFAPPAGPGRAIGLAFRSRFRGMSGPHSSRARELSLLKDILSQNTWNQKYYIISGEKGVGKSCLIESATWGLSGIVNITAKSESKSDEIVEKALQEITKHTRLSLWNANGPAARRVIFWYYLFFRIRPTVVISVSERPAGRAPIDLTAAVRELADSYKLRVIVDSSPNSLDETVLYTERNARINVERMSKEHLFSIPEFSFLFEILDKTGLKEISWHVLGGNPARFNSLLEHIRDNNKSFDLKSSKVLISEFLRNKLLDAVEIIRKAKDANPDLIQLIEIVKKNEFQLPDEERQAKNLKRNNPDKVFTAIRREGDIFLVPASNAIDLALRYGLTKAPSVEQLQNLLSQ